MAQWRFFRSVWFPAFLRVVLIINRQHCSSQTQVLSVAALVIGDHRIYDGTWPAHEKFLYGPIRKHQATKTLDVFVCQKKGNKLPLHMPKPTGVFVVDEETDQKTSFIKCFSNVLNWLCLESKKSSCAISDKIDGRDNLYALGLFTSKYDWILRVRPDSFVVYDLPWPPPMSKDSNLYGGEVFSQVHEGNFQPYKWKHQLTINMVSAVYRKKLLKSNGCPPKEYSNSLHRPCLDISDQFAIVKSSAAETYFGFPLSKYPFSILPNETTKLQSERLLESCQFSNSASAPMENVLNNRLKRHGIVVAPYELPVMLPGFRLKPMTCAKATLRTSLADCVRDKNDREQLIKEMQAMKTHKFLTDHCIT